MKNRKHFKSSIAKLEDLFEKDGDDPKIRTEILAELEHRNTQRARNLKSKIKLSDPPNLEATDIANAIVASTIEPTNNPTLSDVSTSSEPIKYLRREKPAITDDPQNVLQAWTALEVLSPQSFKKKTDFTPDDHRRIASLSDGDLPWERGERSRPKKKLVYEIILGSMSLPHAYDDLLKVFSDSRPDRQQAKGYAAIASVIVDKEGRPLEDDTCFAISSFAWGVPKALEGDLRPLANWPNAERTIKSRLKSKLVNYDDEGDIIPLTKSTIADLFQFLVQELNLGHQKVFAPDFVIRRYEYFGNKTPPEPSLLNSFFLQDLALARQEIENGSASEALKLYLGATSQPKKCDLLNEQDGLVDALRPEITPLGRWPSAGRFPLAMLQQAAVNGTTDHLKDSGILSVNGPPGTGKTTLLRDIVAARLVERAEQMVTFKDPSQAFQASNLTMKRKGATLSFHSVASKLKGFEMVVASSNNKAVENVSAELPALSAVADDASNLRYFHTISNRLLGIETWGTVAAVLGNSSNRYEFSQTFWRDEEHGFSTYLNHAAGVPQFVMEPQDDGPPQKRFRSVVLDELPPNNKREALNRWKSACEEFQVAKGISETARDELQSIHLMLLKIPVIREEILNVTSHLRTLKSNLDEMLVEKQRSATELTETSGRVEYAQEKFKSHNILKPSFWIKLFRLKSYREWLSRYNLINDELANVRDEFRKKDATHNLNKAQFFETEQKILKSEETLAELEQSYSEAKRLVEEAKNKLDAPLPDQDFFNGAADEIQTAHLWFDHESTLQRDQLFEKAMAVHRSFIDCAADEIRQNLAIFTESFGTRALGTTAKDKMIPELWATFFLVVPVISTAFASVNRMFSRLPSEALGWLLIDEAGQAVPQAAVGAIMRTKRSVVVGDPLQIEPVVTLPNTLTEEICGYFGINAEAYNAPSASAQTLADAASPYCARFPSGSGHRDVGSPLLVHRRCDSPMFEISNSIAYANLMVQAKKPSQQTLPLGKSQWFDIVAQSGPDKWCQAEGDKVIELLQDLRNSGADADLYVVTPFVIVQDNLRRMLANSSVLDGWIEKPYKWVYDHVGTVHTVQGREATTVFFVLGAQANNQAGARSWAGGNPNLANVAVTRAKSALYVIGNRSLWKKAGHFETLDLFL